MSRIKLKNDYEIDENIFDPIIPVLYQMVSKIIERKKKEHRNKNKKSSNDYITNRLNVKKKT